MIESKEITAVGKFQKTHALKGELNALLDIAPDYFFEGNAAIVEVDGIFVPFFLSGIRTKGKSSFLIQIDGINDEKEARLFVNKTIFVEKSRLAPFWDIDEEELSDDWNFIGYNIVDTDTYSVLGTVSAMDTSTQNILFIVDTPKDGDVYIPAVDDFIQEVDDEKKIIRMRLPKGLIELNKKDVDNH